MKAGDCRTFFCPKCGCDTTVKETRAAINEDNVIKRRRVCNECGYRIYTEERIVREKEK